MESELREGGKGILKHHEITLYLLSALIRVLYYYEMTYFDYLYLMDYLYRFLELINSFITTILIKGGNNILYHYKLIYIIYLT
jgi:hypothetical protein